MIYILNKKINVLIVVKYFYKYYIKKLLFIKNIKKNNYNKMFINLQYYIFLHKY